MLDRPRLLLAALGAMLVLSCGVATASAARLSTSEQRFNLIWAPIFTTEFGTRVSCPRIVLEGSFHSRTIVKTVGALIGFISRASLSSPCTGGTAGVLAEGLPWHFLYGGFSGTLPRITSLTFRIIGFAFSVTAGGLPACLYRSTTTSPAVMNVGIAADGRTGVVTAGGTMPGPGGLCPATTLSGSGGPSENPLIFTLI